VLRRKASDTYIPLFTKIWYPKSREHARVTSGTRRKDVGMFVKKTKESVRVTARRKIEEVLREK